MGRMLGIAVLAIFLLCTRSAAGASEGIGVETSVSTAWSTLGIKGFENKAKTGNPESGKACISDESGRRIKEAFKLSDALTSSASFTLRQNLKSFPRIKSDIPYHYHIIKAVGPKRGTSFAATMQLFPSGRRSPEKNLFGLEKLRL